MSLPRLLLIIGIGCIALGAVSFVFIVIKRYRALKSGVPAKLVDVSPATSALRNFARSNNFRFISPASLKVGERTAELDAIVVGYFGVLGLKAIGYGGQIYGSADEKQWVQMSDAGKRTPFPNPITEAAADVRVVRDALAAPKIKRVPVEVVCVFTNPKAQLAVPRSLEYHNVKSFKKQLKLEKYMEDCGLDMDEVEGALRAALTEDAK